MYRLSRFVHCVKHGKKTILYHAYRKKIKIIDGVNCHFSDESNKNLMHELIDESYLVDDELNETSFGITEYMKNKYDKKLHLVILPTEECNFRCKYCYEDFRKSKMSMQIINAIIRYIKKSIRNYTSLRIGWFGGEPLCALDQIKYLSNNIIRLCRELKRPYTAEITTNGYLLTPLVFRELLNLKVTYYQVTLDGLPEIHDKYRVLSNGNPTFDVILNNLKAIKSTFDNARFHIAIRVNLTKETLRTLLEYLEYLEREFGEDSRFSVELNLVGDLGGNSKSLSREYIYSLYTVYNSIVENNKILKLVSRGAEQLLYTSACYASKYHSYVIGSDGMLYKCTAAFNDSRNQVGYINNRGDMVLDEIKLSKWDGLGEVCKECLECPALTNCYGGRCPLKRMNNIKCNKKDFLLTQEALLKVICGTGVILLQESKPKDQL